MSDYSVLAHFYNYDPSSFGWPRQADLVPFAYQGVNFGQCARAALPVFTALLDELVPLIPGGIAAVRAVKDDWAYSATDDLPDGSWSFHHYGIALDLDWSVDPMGTNIPDGHGPGSIPRDAATRIARKYGCEWGGNWGGGFHDLMHFEIHLSPAVARTVTPIREDWLAMATKDEVQAVVEQALDAYFNGADGTKRLQDIVWSQVKKPFLPYPGAKVPWLAVSIARLAQRRGALPFEPKGVAK